MSQRMRTPAPANTDSAIPVSKTPPLAERLPGMTDYQLRAYQHSADRISRDARHPKHAAATRALPMIEAEIQRRSAELDRPD